MANFYLTIRKKNVTWWGFGCFSDLSNLSKAPILRQEKGYNMLLLSSYEKSVTDLSLHFAVLEKHCVGKHPWYWSRQNNKTPMLMPSSLQLYSLLCGTLTDVLEQSTPTHFSASACHCICYHRKKTNSNSSSQDVNNGSYWCMLLQTLHSPSPGTSFLLDQDKVCFGT